MEKRHLGELDILRFAAALAVLFFHFAFRGAAADGLSSVSYQPIASIAKYGYLGVELFFIISGFVIMLSAQSGSVITFAIGRIARLYPAFWICCSTTFVAILLSNTSLFPNTVGVWIANMTMMPKSFSAPYIDGSYWSLEFEIKFYTFIALIILIKQVNNIERFMLGWLGCAIFNAFFPMPWIAGKLLLSFAPCFIAGATFFFMHEKGATPLRWTALALSWLLVIRHGIEVCLQNNEYYKVSYSIGIVCAVLTIFFAIFLAIIYGKTGPLGRMKWPLLGALTYPLYLVHQTIGYIIFNSFYEKINLHLLFWGTVALSLAFAYMVAVHFERHASPSLKRFLMHASQRITQRISTAA